MVGLRGIWLTACASVAFLASGTSPLRYEATMTGNAGQGGFAPYYIGANRYGKLTQRSGLQAEGLLCRAIDGGECLSWGFGVDVVAGTYASVPYQRYDASAEAWTKNRQRPGAVWLQQLYGELKYRAIYLSLGMKERGSASLDDRLSSGDLTHSANARPIPQLRAGLVDFQDVPLTGGWLQAEGAVAYGRYTDNDWWRDHFNYYYYHIAQDQWYVYRRLYFRTAPGQRLSVTFGMQAATQFGGSTRQYWGGKLTGEVKRSTRLADFVKALIPLSKGTEDFRIGNTLGSMDIMARYRLQRGDEFRAYMQNPWEDGSGIGKLNGFDGLWGIEFRRATPGMITGVVAEYLDMTNQSGPIHWAPGYVPGTDIVAEATGADDYYNNAYYNSYANYGMLCGSPMVMSPLYNSDGYPAVTANRMRAIHAGVEGNASATVGYRVLMSYRRAWGSGYVPLLRPVHSFSAMLEVTCAVPSVAGMSVAVQGALDRGNLPANAAGVAVAVRYSGQLNAGKP